MSLEDTNSNQHHYPKNTFKNAGRCEDRCLIMIIKLLSLVMKIKPTDTHTQEGECQLLCETSRCKSYSNQKNVSNTKTRKV